MKEVITRDGSVTLFNENFGEHYHSITVGAIEEAMEKYVKPSELKDGNKVLDFCFGLGYNSLAALMVADVEIIGLEIDPEILGKIAGIEVPEEFKENYEEIKKDVSGNSDKIKIIVGDARKNLKNLSEKFDAVLFDPFSPKVCPELWTEEVFLDIGKLMKPGGRLTTYSCARIVRNNLEKAGFVVSDGPCFGRRAPSTVAIYK